MFWFLFSVLHFNICVLSISCPYMAVTHDFLQYFTFFPYFGGIAYLHLMEICVNYMFVTCFYRMVLNYKGTAVNLI